MINNEIIKLKFDNSFNGRLFAVQGDTGRVFNLQVFDDFSKPVDVTGMKLRMYVANSKEVSYSEGEIVTATEGKIKVQVYNSQLKYPGKQKAQFVLADKEGQKIGSKIFDLWVEEGLEAGSTVGNNIYVDFETIKEALGLLKDYDKTLEEAKKVDSSLKLEIKKGTDTREDLASCKKKALEIKGQLDNSKTDANKTLSDLNKTKTESETLKSSLVSENKKAASNKSDLSEKIESGKATTSELNKSITDAKANKTNLDKSNTTALATKKSIEDATTAANTTKENLSNLKTQGDTLSGDLTAQITYGKSLKSNLDASVSNAKSTKSNLDTSVETATSTNTTLKATDTEAKKTEALIKDLMSQLGKTKNEVEQIIASGDLSKYVTDPKLQEVLKDYASKNEFNKSFDKKIDKIAITDNFEEQSQDKVLSQKGANDLWVTADNKIQTKYMECIKSISGMESVVNDKANQSDIPTKLSQLTNDKNYKTETEIQSMIEKASSLKKEVVTSLPTTGKDDVIYLVQDPKGKDNNNYLEYLWLNGKYELIGSTQVDLSGYVTTNDIQKMQHEVKQLGETSRYLTYTVDNKADKTAIKTKLSEMTSDSTHRTVTDSEKSKWNKKFELPQGKENQVLTKTTNGAEFKNISSSRSATFVIANYDSSENSKSGADYVIQENESPCDVINSFINKLPSYGGKIQLTEGNFIEKDDKSINLNKDNITLSGYGKSTNLERTIENAKIEFIKIFNSNITLENFQSNPKNENAVWFSENSNKCKLFNITGTSSTVVFAIDGGTNHQLSNCSGVSTGGSVFKILGSNHQLSNCSVTSANLNAFQIIGSNNRLSNCSGTSANNNAFFINGSANNLVGCFGEITLHKDYACFFIQSSNNRLSNCSGTSANSMVFYINGSNNQLSNCSGTSTNNAAFFINGLNNLLSNCSGTSTNNSGYYINGSQISVIGCFGESKKPSDYFDVLFGEKSSKCIGLGIQCYNNKGLRSKGTGNILANNINIWV